MKNKSFWESVSVFETGLSAGEWGWRIVTLVIIGGSGAVSANFNDCGDIVALPENVSMTGIVVLKNCTVEDCEFVRISIFTDQVTARGFRNASAQVKGLPS
ncbi:MAG: hypothetical protein M1147_01705 [Nitrospirae bacterium]|nr:hypothetical protein [Nitrospirota bacterium]MCL5976825.1 hypothetical protein [Nitrospirota bacterium]